MRKILCSVLVAIFAFSFGSYASADIDERFLAEKWLNKEGDKGTYESMYGANCAAFAKQVLNDTYGAGTWPGIYHYDGNDEDDRRLNDTDKLKVVGQFFNDVEGYTPTASELEGIFKKNNARRCYSNDLECSRTSSHSNYCRN